MRRALPLLLLLSGCCSGPELGLEAFDPRLELPTRATFALIGPVLDDPTAWAYADPPAAVRAFEAQYRAEPSKRPPGVAVPFPDPRALRPADAAPQDLRTAFAAAREGLIALGYRPAKGERADVVVSLAVTRRAAGALNRVSISLGAVADGRFEPFRLTVAAVLPEDDPCPTPLDRLVADMIAVLPPRSAAP